MVLSLSRPIRLRREAFRMTASHSKTPARKTAAKAKAKAARPKRRKPISKNIRSTAMANFQKLRRMQEANDEGLVQCISCGKVMHWKEAQGGHYIPRAIRPTEMDPDNVWPQCPQCNGVRAGNLIAYRYALVRKIGEARVKRLEDMRAAYKGDQEAFESLAPADQRQVLEKRGKLYYAEKNRDIRIFIRDEEDRLGCKDS